jgi:sulfite exporter TauE/SafE/copper chaperone CopZ
MERALKTVRLRIEGMTCMNCRNKIEQQLRAAPGVETAEVSYAGGTAAVGYDENVITLREITAAIEKLDYRVYSGDTPREHSYRNAGLLVLIAALFMLARRFGLADIFNAFPLAETGMGYGMLFIIGLVTSVHCVAMCGGINLSQCIPRSGEGGTALLSALGPALRPGLLYNLGRVVSYTLIGVMVGALGQVISFSGAMKGVVQLAAGVFMLIMGINMLGLFPGLRRFSPRLPGVFTRYIDRKKAGSNSPLYIGLLNGLMPCGPLQAMQLYALSTGSPLKGGLSMLLFSLGTVPLMFGLGALSSALGKKFTRAVMSAGAVLVAVLGLSMFANGWALSGFPALAFPMVFAAGVPAGSPASGADALKNAAELKDGIQEVATTLASGRYQPITVQVGIPVRWTIEAPAGSINGCNNRMIIPEYKLEHTFKTGTNVVEFTPAKTGVFRYSCWMGMIRSSITVVEQGAVPEAAVPQAPGEDIWEEDITEPVPAGFRIPTGTAALGTLDGDLQRVKIDLSDQGFSPALVVMQAGTEAAWTIANSSRREENFTLLFPAYGQQVAIETGDNVLSLYPQADFEFSTSDSEYYGYVKVVEDLETMDLEAVKREAGAYQTMIYPADYFQAAGAGCCRQ